MKTYLKAHLVDFIIIGSLFVFALICLIVIETVSSKKDNLKAEVYLKGELVLSIDLDKEEGEREIALNDDISIMVKKGAIKVLSNNCPTNYCVSQGYTSSVLKPIICAYHGLYIKIIDNNSDIDVVTG